MNRRASELLLRRGRLLERIAAQRADLVHAAQPVRAALDTVDRVAGGVHAGIAYVKRNPVVAALAVAALFVIKGRRLWQWSKRAFIVWRAWRALRARIPMFGIRVGR